MTPLERALISSASKHDHLCPRQVLGVRMGLAGGRLLGLSLPQQDKRLLVIAETDGCLCDGIEAATGCSVGHRTLRVEDFGKVAATFIDTRRQTAFRIAPQPQARQRAAEFIPPGGNRWDGQLIGYQRLAEDLLLTWAPVVLNVPIEQIVGAPGTRAICDRCHEEILNRREIVRTSVTLCRACAGWSYYCATPEHTDAPLTFTPVTGELAAD